MEVFRIAIDALRRHKLRSFLTLLGVIIGVATVVAVVSIIAGLNNYVAEKLFQLNPDVFVASQFGIITSRDEFLEAVRRKRIDMDDVRTIERQCSRCGMIGVGAQTNLQVRYGSQRATGVQVFGETSNMAELNNLDLETGRFFTNIEEQHSAPVAVIGSDVREQLFGKLDPIGRVVTVSGHSLKVIGLMRKQGSVLGQSQDNQLHMPLQAYRKFFGTRRSLNIFVRARDGVAGLQAAEDEVRVILRNRRHTPFRDNDPFGMVTADAVQQVWNRISAGAFALMVCISGIALVVGGIVIMNIMLVSVVERTREIGIRRAIGATARDISRQFLLEAVILSAIGGIAGVLLGIGISSIVKLVFPLPTLVRPSFMLMGLAIAVVTGLAAGYFPARRAARLAPVEALRWE